MSAMVEPGKRHDMMKRGRVMSPEAVASSARPRAAACSWALSAYSSGKQARRRLARTSVTGSWGTGRGATAEGQR